jgi:CheY-like chemotaxis protein
MAIQEVVTITDLAKRIQVCSQNKFTGQLDLRLKETDTKRWSLFFCLGALIWGYSPVHPIRRCHRQISQHCPQLPIRVVRPLYWDYNYLVELVQQGRIQREQMAAIVESNIGEILFDLHQQGTQLPYGSGLKLAAQSMPQKTIDLLIDSSLVLIPSDRVWQQAQQDWEAWQQAGLNNCSPNQAPIIWKTEELQRQTSLLAYYNLRAMADGKQTLRDLAVKLKQNLLLLTQSLMPSIRQGLMGLVEVEDVNSSFQPVTLPNSKPQLAAVLTSRNQTPSQAQSPLVAYIDDSPNDSRTMSHILTKAGYRFVNIQDPVTALPILLEQKPDLIFLDLVMPVANGYEVCAQIRRVSMFKDTPVIILTSNDGIVDRVRAKMVGSSGFLAKPIDADKVLSVLQKYLVTPPSGPAPRSQNVREWFPGQ